MHTTCRVLAVLERLEKCVLFPGRGVSELDFFSFLIYIFLFGVQGSRDTDQSDTVNKMALETQVWAFLGVFAEKQ